jgi:hypothetical protein
MEGTFLPYHHQSGSSRLRDDQPLGNGTGNPRVLLSVPVPVPVPTRTRNPRVTSDGSRRVRVSSGVGSIFLFNYILNDNYQTTLRAGARRHGGGLRVDPEKRKKEKRNGPGDACPLGQRKENKKTKTPRRQVSPGSIPSSLVASTPPRLLWHGRLRGGPRCGWCWCRVPPLFPRRSSSSCPLAVHCLLVPIVVVLNVPAPIAPRSYPAAVGGAVVVAVVIVFSSPLFVVRHPVSVDVVVVVGGRRSTTPRAVARGGGCRWW